MRKFTTIFLFLIMAVTIGAKSLEMKKSTVSETVPQLNNLLSQSTSNTGTSTAVAAIRMMSSIQIPLRFMAGYPALR